MELKKQKDMLLFIYFYRIHLKIKKNRKPKFIFL